MSVLRALIRALFTAGAIVLSAAFTFTVLFPLAFIALLVMVVSEFAAAAMFAWFVLTAVYWLFTHDPVAARGAVFGALYGTAALIPSATVGWIYGSIKARGMQRIPKLTLDEPFEDRSQRQRSPAIQPLVSRDDAGSRG